MITPEDIEAFEASNEAAIKAATEYARRAQKGLPADRWTDGTTGCEMVARGIKAMQGILAMQNEMLVAAFNQIQESGAEAMRLHTADSKYAQK